MAADYRQTGVDYRDAVRNYYGFADATVTPATIAATTAVPQVKHSLDYRETGTTYRQTATTYAGVDQSDITVAATVTPATVVAVATVPAHTLAVGVTLAAGTIAATTTAPSPTIVAEAVVAAGVVTGISAVPSAQASQTANATPSPVAALAGIGALTSLRCVILDTTNTLPSLAKGDTDYRPLTAANRLARHYSPRAKGVNVWIASGAVTTTQPSDNTTITRTLYGGHEGPDDLTETESDLLAAAGYRIDVEAA